MGMVDTVFLFPPEIGTADNIMIEINSKPVILLQSFPLAYAYPWTAILIGCDNIEGLSLGGKVIRPTFCSCHCD